jgi:crotonobetainyl-CoA:carnitine CoA-transferase CaiB-like acyl-CoA transferase
MSGETADRESGWTTDTLHSHVQRQIDDLRRLLDERYATQTKALDAAFAAADKAVTAALLAAKEAVNKAEAAAEKRFESVNEFRAQLSDQAATFVPRGEADARFSALDEKLATALSHVDQDRGRGRGIEQIWAALIAVVAVAVAFYSATR